MATIYAGKGKVNQYNPYLSLTVAKSSQSVDGNYSMVSYTLKLHRPKNVSSSASKDYSFTVAGTTFTGTYTISGSGDKIIKSGTLKVPHGADGSKTISYSMSVEIAVTWNGVYIGTVPNSGTLALPTIPRATQIMFSSIDTGLTYMGDTLSMVMDRASSSFTHDLAYSFEGGSYVSIGTGLGTSKSWAVPDLASKIPNKTSGSLKIRCITKNGSTTIGTTYATATVYVPTDVKPTVTGLTATEAVSGLDAQFGAFIQGKSRVDCKITGTGAKGSTLTEYQATFAGSSYSGSYAAASWRSAVLATAGTLTVKARVKDSRGRWSDYKTLDIDVLAYEKPKIEKFNAYRCSDMLGTEDPAGEYVAIRYKYSVTSLGSTNTASMTVSFKEASAEEYTALLTNTARSADTLVVPSRVFSNSKMYDFKMELTDWFNVTPYTEATALIPTEEVIMDIKANGLGLAIGGVATRSRALESFWPIVPSDGMEYKVLPNGTNLSSRLRSGVYLLPKGNTYADRPPGDYDGILEVLTWGSTADDLVTLQRLTQVGTDRTTVYQRGGAGGVLSMWRDPYGWEIITLEAAENVTIGTLVMRYNADLCLVELHGSVTYKPKASAAAGAAVPLAYLPPEMVPSVNAPLSVYRISETTGWVKAAANTDGELIIRTGGALTANASATYFLGGMYYHEA